MMITNMPIGENLSVPVVHLIPGIPCVVANKEVLNEDGIYIAVFDGEKGGGRTKFHPWDGKNQVLQEIRIGDFIGLYVQKEETLFVNSFYVDFINENIVHCIRAEL